MEGQCNQKSESTFIDSILLKPPGGLQCFGLCGQILFLLLSPLLHVFLIPALVVSEKVLEASVVGLLVYKGGSLFPLNRVCTQKSLENCLATPLCSQQKWETRGFGASLGGQTMRVSTCPLLLWLIWWCSHLVFLQVMKYVTATGEAFAPTYVTLEKGHCFLRCYSSLYKCVIESSFPYHLL